MKGLAESQDVEFAAIGPNVDLAAMTAKLQDSSSRIRWIGLPRVMRLGAKPVERADRLNEETTAKDPLC